MKFARIKPELVGLIVAAFVTRFITLFSPNAVVFDEVYFKAFAAHYFDHRYYFDIHPPLGKLLLAGFAHLLGLHADQMLNGTAVGLRLLPAFAGALLVPLMWGILRRLGANRWFAFLGAAAILLDNALMVESRFILMDSMLLLFGLSGLYFYLVARDAKTNRGRWLALIMAATTAGAAVSIKWTGLTALALIGLLWLWDIRGHAASWGRRLAELALFALIPVVIYVSAFFVHFALLPNSGDGDAFMSEKFQATLQNSSYYGPSVHLSFWQKLSDLNVEMFRANQTLTATHPYGSHWYSWPLEQRPIYYWEGNQLPGGKQGNIYLLGNPIVWWGIWLAIVYGLVYSWLSRRKLRPATIAALAVAGAAYMMNLLPFMAVTRVMFLYHYFFSFCFSLIFAIMLWQDLVSGKGEHPKLSTAQTRQIIAVTVFIALGFLYFAPLSYGWPLTTSQLQSRMWLHTWR